MNMRKIYILALLTVLPLMTALQSHAAELIATQNYIKPGCSKQTLHHGYGVKVTGIRCGGPAFIGVVSEGYIDGFYVRYNPKLATWEMVAAGYTGTASGSSSWQLVKN